MRTDKVFIILVAASLGVFPSCGKANIPVVLDYNGGRDRLGNLSSTVVYSQDEGLLSSIPSDIELPLPTPLKPIDWTSVANDRTTAVSLDTFSPQKGTLTRLYAYYQGGESNYVTVNFVTGIDPLTQTEASPVADQKVLKGRSAQSVDKPTLPGYDFVSWSTFATPQFAYSDNDFNSLKNLVNIETHTFTSPVKLTAAWRKSVTTITYVVGQRPNNPDTVLTTDATPSVRNIDKFGKFTSSDLPVLTSTMKHLPFLGWSTRTYGGSENNATLWTGFGDPAYIVKVGDTAKLSDIVLYASFGPELVLVDGGTVLPSQTWSVSSGDEVIHSSTSQWTIPKHMIGKYEVTSGLWREVMEGKAFTNKGEFKERVQKPYQSKSGSRVLFEEPNFQRVNGSAYIAGGATEGPVNQVTWCEAVIFCNELTRMLFGNTSHQAYSLSTMSDLGWQDQTIDTDLYSYHNSLDWASSSTGTMNRQPYPASGKRGFRLPTEWEWEWDARGGNPLSTLNWKLTYFGSDSINEVAVWGNGRMDSTTPRIPNTKAVGSLKPNLLGLFDMTGNVSEWMTTSTNSGTAKAITRGGSYYSSNPTDVLKRVPVSANTASSQVGFRLVKNV